MDNAHRVVSSEAEELILVDEHDNEIGHLSKAACHDGDGVLHRAFSVFLFDDRGRLLLQRRAATKRLWPGYWSNSCCSHPRRGESLATATSRRLADELNVTAELEHVYRFRYQARFDQGGSEHELCHVFVGRFEAEVEPNASEIDAIRLLSVDEVEREVSARADSLTPWFRMEWRALTGEFAETLGRYAM
ncbi:MAG: isopentenyl-diphosphate Delta-isomerase [Woeseiaceae bacterium]|nr:isopentenyl-diphosphate Delta-isomerase [Woeseiaceae bacterium]